MSTRNAPPARAPAPAPSTAVAVPAKKTKLAIALDKANEAVSKVQSMQTEIEELERTAGPTTAFDVKTKAGKAVADTARKKAREHRLALKNMRDESTAMFNGIKQELWGVLDPFIERLDKIEKNAKNQLEAAATAEADRKKGHEGNIAVIRALAQGMQDFTEDQMRERLLALGAIIVDDSYEEYRAEAEKAVTETRASIEAAIDMEQKRKRAAANMETMRGWKALPESVKGTGIENVTEMLRIHRTQEPTAETFGEMLDFAKLTHSATSTLLEAYIRELETEAQAADEGFGLAGPDPDADMPEEVAAAHAGDDGPSLFPEEDDPFSKPIATPAPTPAPRGSAPPPRRGAAPTTRLSAGQVQHGTVDGLAPGAARIHFDEPRTTEALGELAGYTPGMRSDKPVEVVEALRAAGHPVPGYIEALIHGMPITQNGIDLDKAADGVLHLFKLLPRNVTIELEDGPLGRGFISAVRYLDVALQQHNARKTNPVK